jgi:protein subunit release factor A
MSTEVLGEFYDGRQDRAWLLVSGLGAFGLLKHESGLHQVARRTRERKQRTGHEAVREDRETVRAEVFALGGEPDKKFRQAVKPRLIPRRPAQERLLQKADLAVSLFHEPTLRSLELWTSGPRAQALERSLLILHTQLTAQAAGSDSRPDQTIRHYDLGVSPRVKDTRSGRTTTRIDRVFRGYLDALLV